MYSSFITGFGNAPGASEDNKFIQLAGDTRVPAMTVISVSPAFDGANSSLNPLLSTTTVYQKYAVLTYCVNAGDTAGGTTTATNQVLSLSTTNTNTTYTSATSASTSIALAANASRNYFYIQNLDITPLFVSFGTVCSVSAFSVILPAGTAKYNGTGGAWGKDFNYKGQVTVYASPSGTYNAWDA
jgi:hypothetical protein